MTPRVAILGAGGHARVVEDILTLQIQAGAGFEFAGFIGRAGVHSPLPLLGVDDDLSRLFAKGVLTHVVIGLGAVLGGPSSRTKLEAKIDDLGVPFFIARHPSAVIAHSVKIDDGSVIMAGAIINPGTRIGRNAIVNTRSSIDHDCQISDGVHIAPGATLSGGVTVGARTLIGVGASCKQGITIGSDVTVAAGAVVISDAPSKSTVIGVPGKVRGAASP